VTDTDQRKQCTRSCYSVTGTTFNGDGTIRRWFR